ncbi:hypothetical protein [Rubritalea tangerina]
MTANGTHHWPICFFFLLWCPQKDPCQIVCNHSNYLARRPN